jgi:hypothetical protein
MCRTRDRICADVSVVPYAGIRGLRFMIAPPPAIVSKSASSGLADIASRDA